MQKKNKVVVVARMTMTKADGNKLIVEVRADASFHQFYCWFSQAGRKRKVYLRSSHRGDGLHGHHPYKQPGLDVLAEAHMKCFKTIQDAKIKVFKKRAYQALLNCAPDELAGGLPKITVSRPSLPVWQKAIPVRIPVGYLPLQKRMDILTGVHR